MLIARLLATLARHAREIITAFKEKRLSSEQVAARVAAEVRHFLAHDAPVGEHLADQLLLPMALGSGGRLRTLTPSSHTQTQVALLRHFIGSEVRIERESEAIASIDVPAPG